MNFIGRDFIRNKTKYTIICSEEYDNGDKYYVFTKDLNNTKLKDHRISKGLFDYYMSKGIITIL